MGGEQRAGARQGRWCAFACCGMSASHSCARGTVALVCRCSRARIPCLVFRASGVCTARGGAGNVVTPLSVVRIKACPLARERYLTSSQSVPPLPERGVTASPDGTISIKAAVRRRFSANSISCDLPSSVSLSPRCLSAASPLRPTGLRRGQGPRTATLDLPYCVYVQR